MNEGKILACDSPDALKRQIAGDVLVIQPKSGEPGGLASQIQNKFRLSVLVAEGLVQIECEQAAKLIPQLVESFPDEIGSVTLRKPTLEDVFLHQTKHRFWAEEREKS